MSGASVGGGGKGKLGFQAGFEQKKTLRLPAGPCADLGCKLLNLLNRQLTGEVQRRGDTPRHGVPLFRRHAVAVSGGGHTTTRDVLHPLKANRAGTVPAVLAVLPANEVDLSHFLQPQGIEVAQAAQWHEEKADYR